MVVSIYICPFHTLVVIIFFQLRWSYGVQLLTQADPEPSDSLAQETLVVETDPLLSDNGGIRNSEEGHSVEPTVLFANVDDTIGKFQSAPTHSDSSWDRTHALETDTQIQHSHFFYSFPNTPNRSAVRLPKNDPSLPNVSFEGRDETHDRNFDDDEDDDEPITTFRRRRQFVAPTSNRFHSFLRRTNHRISKWLTVFNSFMTVPLWAALASIIVACVPPLQHALEVHVQPIKSALTAAGNCSIPLTLVILGAYFHSPEDNAKDISLPASPHDADDAARRLFRHGSSASLHSRISLVGSVRSMLELARVNHRPRGSAGKQPLRPGETKTVMIAVLSRMILTPLVLLPLMAISAKYNWPEVFDE